MKYFLAAILSLMFVGGSEPKHTYVLIYLEHHSPTMSWQFIDPCMAFGSCCTETKVAWFANIEDALTFLNAPKGDVLMSSDGTLTKNILSGADFVGLYEVKDIPVHQEQVGTEKRMVTETVERELPKVEWRVRP